MENVDISGQLLFRYQKKVSFSDFTLSFFFGCNWQFCINFSNYWGPFDFRGQDIAHWKFAHLSQMIADNFVKVSPKFWLITFHKYKLITDQFVTNWNMTTTHFPPTWLPKAGSCWRPRITPRRSWRGRRRRQKERPEGGRLIQCMSTHSHSFQRWFLIQIPMSLLSIFQITGLPRPSILNFMFEQPLILDELDLLYKGDKTKSIVFYYQVDFFNSVKPF